MSRQRSLIFFPVPRRKDREHSWKHHCRSSLTREVLGVIDMLAAAEEARSGLRFVFIGQDALLALCFKGPRKEGKRYSKDRLKHVFEELREQHIISRYFETGGGRYGFIVAPHDSLCCSDGKTCLLPNRAAWQFVEQKTDWRSKVVAALRHSKQHRCSTQNSTEPSTGHRF